MSKNKLKSIYNLSLKDLKSFLIQHGLSEHIAPSLFEFFYKKNQTQNISENTWKLLKKHFHFDLPEIVKTEKASDGTIKFLMELSDKRKVETVLIPFHKRYTICLSSQVGCAMKCSFCFTGTQGLTRNLESSEIIGQYIKAKQFLEKEISSKAITPNIVFMGQGEPLHNFDEVKQALSLFLDPQALALGPRQITLSTAGYLPGLKKFNSLPQINLALSLHSPFNELRKTLIPITGQYPIEEIFLSLQEIKLMKRQFITYEYLLIDGVNDRLVDAIALKKLLEKTKALINIIPFNPFPGSVFTRPSPEKVMQFKEMLAERNLRTMIRSTKGSDILAACGQLNS
jgi:23S rRNA (adenine2503-C2)-methyltransferase